MSWLPLALLAALLYGVQNAASRAATKGVSNEVGAIVLEAAAAAGVLAYALARARPITGEARSLAWAIGGGLAVAGGNVAYFALLRKGAPLSTMGPVVLAATAVVTAVLGFVFFGEKLSIARGVGLALAAAAIALLSRS